MNNLNNKSNKKISQLKLDVVRFDAQDVIATSLPEYLPTLLTAEKDELVANLNFTYSEYTNAYYNIPTEMTPGYFYEPTSGQ